MKKGDRFINRKTRRVVIIKERYNSLGRIVINYIHASQAKKVGAEVGAAYLANFNTDYRPERKKVN